MRAYICLQRVGMTHNDCCILLYPRFFDHIWCDQFGSRGCAGKSSAVGPPSFGHIWKSKNAPCSRRRLDRRLSIRRMALAKEGFGGRKQPSDWPHQPSAGQASMQTPWNRKTMVVLRPSVGHILFHLYCHGQSK